MTNRVKHGKIHTIQLAGQDPDGNRISIHFKPEEFKSWLRDVAKEMK